MYPAEKECLKGKKSLTVSRSDKKTMGKIACIAIVFFFFAGMFSGTALAHPPKSITLSYDNTTKTLKVTILHPSFMPSWHYIKTVTVSKNKEDKATYSYKSQPGDEFTYTYEISAEPGDTFVVNAYCSMYGSRTEGLKILSGKAP